MLCSLETTATDGISLFDANAMDAARFIMITAAFEWEYKRNFSDEVSKKDNRLRAEVAVADEIEEKIRSSAGKK